MLKTFLFIVIVSISLYANKNKQSQTINELFFKFMYENNIKSLSFATMKNDEMLYSKYYELTNEKLIIKPNNHYRFRIASISKPFTSTAIMQLIQNKKLSLNNYIFGGKCLEFSQKSTSCLKYQKGLFETKYQTRYGTSIIPNNSRIYNIKLIHLLEHTTGTWNKTKGFAGDPMAYKENLNHTNLIKFVLKNTYNVLPDIKQKNIWIIPQQNSKFLYSNFGYSLLGRIIEKTSNLSYNQYIQKNILSKLNINTMYLAGEGDKNKEVIYFRKKTNKKAYPDYIVNRYDSHGGWTATAEDLVKFGMQFNENLYPVKNILGLNNSSIKLLKTPTSQLAKQNKYAKGFSLYLKDSSGWGHNGKLPGSLAYLRCNPKNNICYSAIINTDIDKKTEKKFKNLLQHIAYNRF